MVDTDRFVSTSSTSTSVDRFAMKTLSDSSLASEQTKGKSIRFEFKFIFFLSISYTFQWLRIEPWQEYTQSNLFDCQLSSTVGQGTTISSNVC